MDRQRYAMQENLITWVTNNVIAERMQQTWKRIFLLAFLAGVYVSFGAVLSTQVLIDGTLFFGYGVGRLIAGAAFSVGIIFVVIAGSELFTGNNLWIMALLSKKTTLWELINKLVLIYCGNMLGALFMVILIFFSGICQANDGQLGYQAISIAQNKVSLSWLEAFTRGMLCNWLVCLAVWMSMSAKEIVSKVLVILLPIMTFVALGFEHCVANMYYIPMGLLLKTTTFAGINLDLTKLTLNGFACNLFAITAGNLVSGMILVGLFYWLALRPKEIKE